MAMKSDTSRNTTLDSKGFTLIATLMLLLIMSGIAIGLLMMVNTEGKVGSQDTQNNLAFHAAEGGIEPRTWPTCFRTSNRPSLQTLLP